MTDQFSDPKGPRPDPSGPMGHQHSSAEQPLNDLKSAVAEDMKHARDTLARDGKAAAGKLKDTASEKAHFAAHQLSGLGAAMEKVGSELEGSDQQHVGKYVRRAGGSVSAFAHKMEGRDASDIARSLQDFGREQPLAFLGMAALAGLTASRFLTASAHRPAESSVQRPEDPAANPASSYAASPAPATPATGEFNG